MKPSTLRVVAVAIALVAMIVALGPAIEGIYDGRSALAFFLLAIAVFVAFVADMREGRA